MPEFYDRNGWTPEAERDLVQKALGKVRELVAAHEKPSDREEQLAAAREVVGRARRALMGA